MAKLKRKGLKSPVQSNPSIAHGVDKAQRVAAETELHRDVINCWLKRAGLLHVELPARSAAAG